MDAMDAKKEDETRRKDHPSLVAGLPKSSPFLCPIPSHGSSMVLYGN